MNAAAAFPDPAQLPAMASLPDPLVDAAGRRIATRREWQRQRRALLRAILHYQYGSLPPAPRNVTAEAVRKRQLSSFDATEHELLLRMGPQQSVTTSLVLTRPRGRGPFPVIVRGDLGWGAIKPEIAAAVIGCRYVLAEFDRTHVAADAPVEEGVYRAYPAFDGGRIAAWAWGFHRVVDWLRTQDFVDARRIVVTGHSRGGKAALLAGAIDTRIALTVPNNSGCGGAGCYRFQHPGSEDIAAILTTFPYWFHARFRQFIGRVERLPFDQHTLKALVAPRALLSTEALGDLWANPKGSEQTHLAAREVFAFLGAAKRIGIRFREGGHEHNVADWMALLDFADAQLSGTTIPETVADADGSQQLQ